MMQRDLFESPNQPSIKTLNGIVLEILRGGQYWMPHELCRRILNDHKVIVSDASITARLRDLRKAKFGSHVIEKRKRQGSTAYEYRLAKP